MSKRLIYAEDAIDAATSSVMEWDEMYVQDLNVRISEAIQKLPSAQPTEASCWGCNCPKMDAQPDLDEWCTDCKEYDSEKHCCPRFNHVIRKAMEMMESNS